MWLIVYRDVLTLVAIILTFVGIFLLHLRKAKHVIPIPAHTKTIELTNSVLWLDEDGILYSASKPDSFKVLTREETEGELRKLRELIGDKKVCMILETNSSAPPPKKEDRDWIAKELDAITKAMAIIALTPLSRMVANLFFGLKPPAYPAKFFGSVPEARKWIKKYL